MSNSKFFLRGLLHSILVVIYITLVAYLMFNVNNWFGQMNGAFGAIAFLLLFVLSAITVGSLVLGKPILLYLESEKKSALALLFYTVAWLFIWLIITFLIMAII